MGSNHKTHILVIDDSESVALTLAMLLQAQGYTCTHALAGKEAIQMASAIQFDVALIDVNMPEINGIETAIKICRKLKTCKILLMSGDPASEPLLERAGKNG